MRRDHLIRLVGPRLRFSHRALVACIGAAIAALLGEVLTALNGDGHGLMILALVLGLPVGGLLLTIRHQNLLLVGVVLTGALFPFSAAAYHAAGTSSTAGLTIVWVPYVGVPIALTIALVDRFIVRDSALVRGLDP